MDPYFKHKRSMIHCFSWNSSTLRMTFTTYTWWWIGKEDVKTLTSERSSLFELEIFPENPQVVRWTSSTLLPPGGNGHGSQGPRPRDLGVLVVFFWVFRFSTQRRPPRVMLEDILKLLQVYVYLTLKHLMELVGSIYNIYIYIIFIKKTRLFNHIFGGDRILRAWYRGIKNAGPRKRAQGRAQDIPYRSISPYHHGIWRIYLLNVAKTPRAQERARAKRKGSYPTKKQQEFLTSPIYI